MSTKIIDLDALVPPDKKVNFAGRTYTVPGDMPMPIFLAVQRAMQGENEDAADEVSEIAFELLAWNIKEDDEGARDELRRALRSVGVTTTIAFINAIYTDASDEPEAPEGQPDPSA